MRRLASQVREMLTRRPQTIRTRPQVELLEDRSVPATASGLVSGTAFIDINGSGTRDAGELLLPGVSVRLRGQTDLGKAVNVRVVTNELGTFEFQNVLPGSYRVSARVPALMGVSAGFGGVAAPDGVTIIAPQKVVGGGIAGQNLGFRGLAPGSISLRQLRNTTDADDFAFGAAGRGQTAVAFRENNTPFVKALLSDLSRSRNAANEAIDLAGFFGDGDFTNSIVRFATSEGNLDFELFDAQAPRTVANFFNYILSNRYDSTIFHRLVNDFVIQGGGFKLNTNPSDLDAVPTDSAVANEFGITNSAGTLSMAKFGNDPNSATSQFFINLKNNNVPNAATSNLDTLNGGFTVFGRITAASQSVLQRLTSYTIRNVGAAPFNEVPLKNYTGSAATFPGDTTADNFALIKDVSIVKRDEFLTYTVVSNSNPSSVAATIKDNRLTLDYLALGTTTIKVRATDRFGAFVEQSFDVTVTNTAPTATVSLSPVTVGTNTLLTATATRADVDGDPVTLTYEWKVGANVVKTTTTTSLTDTLDLSVAGNGDKGDTITVTVTPNDGTLTGAAVTAQTVVQNSAPQVTSVTLSPDPVFNDDDLTANVVFTDANGDPVTLTYVWTINNVVVPGATTDTLDSSLFVKGDIVKVTVTPNDGTINGTPGTDEITVSNSLPTIGSLSLSTTSPSLAAGTLQVDALGATDGDGDAIQYVYTWFALGVDDELLLLTSTSNIGDAFNVLDLNPAVPYAGLGRAIQVGDRIVVQVSAFDGASGPVVTSEEATVVA